MKLLFYGKKCVVSVFIVCRAMTILGQAWIKKELPEFPATLRGERWGLNPRPSGPQSDALTN